MTDVVTRSKQQQTFLDAWENEKTDMKICEYFILLILLLPLLTGFGMVVAAIVTQDIDLCLAAIIAFFIHFIAYS